MAETFKNMKSAIGGQGGGLQEASSVVGETMAENSDTRGPASRKADSASESLGQFAKGAPGATTEGTNVSASDQIANMHTGSADHLDMGFRKKD